MLDDTNRKFNGAYDNTELRICKKISDDIEVQNLCEQVNVICDEYLIFRIVMHFRKFVFRLLSEQRVITIRIPMLGTIITYENCIKGRQRRFKREARRYCVY